MSIKVTEQVLARRANTLELKIGVSYNETNSSNNSNNAYYNSYNRGSNVFTPKVGYSSKITIDDRVAFQAMFFEYKSGVAHYLVKFSTTRKNDKLDYKVNLLHYKENDKTSVIVKQCKSDDIWYSVTDSLCFGFYNVKLIIDIAPMARTYSAIHEDTDFTDFQLRGTDGSVHMHKAVAAASSPFFKTLFAGSWRENADGIVDVPETSVETLKQLKKYMYLGTVPESTDVTKLLLLSSCYMMPDLEARCAYELCKQTTTETAYELIQFAVKHNMSQLLFEILLLIQENKLDVNEMKNLYKPC